MLRQKPASLIAVAFALIVATAYGVYVSASRPAANALAPAIAPAGMARLKAMTLPDPAGRLHTVGAWKGKILIVNFWATWCPPCRKEMPAFSRLHQKLADKGVQFVGIGIDSPSAIKEFALRTPVSYPLLIGGSEGLELTRALGNRTGALPHTIVFGRDGEAIFSRVGMIEEDQLENLLKPLLGG